MRIPSGAIRSNLVRLMIAGVVLQGAPLSAQYRDHRALSGAVQQLAQRYRTQAELTTLATSAGGRPVQMLRVGAAGKPGILVIANAHGPHLIGSEVAIAAAEKLLSSPGNSLDRATYWFIPRFNPDAAEGMFATPKWERTGNDKPYDTDRDGTIGEDPLDDLNSDGVITQMRIADPNGAWIADSADPRLLRRADAAKGEVGKWRVLTEGRDNDGDGAYNEDGPGGTDLNRNFTYNYPHHGLEAGMDPLSEAESMALAQFLVDHPEIAVIYVLGPQDNVMQPWQNRPSQGIANQQGVRAQEGTSAGGPLNSIMRGDQDTYADIGRRFKEITGLSGTPSSASSAGDVLSWAYYHYGRFAIGSRAWWVPDAPREGAARPAAGGGSDPLAEQRNALKWFESEGIDAFAPWTGVTLPNESGVEVGGFKPGMLINPPAGAQFDSTIARQTRFIAALGEMMPKVSVRDPKVTAAGNGVYRIEVEIANDGDLPTTAAIATRLRFPQLIALELDVGRATVLSGQTHRQVGPIAGGGRTTTLRWTVAAPAGTTMTLKGGSPVTGNFTRTITLR